MVIPAVFEAEGEEGEVAGGVDHAGLGGNGIAGDLEPGTAVEAEVGDARRVGAEEGEGDGLPRARQSLRSGGGVVEVGDVADGVEEDPRARAGAAGRHGGLQERSSVPPCSLHSVHRCWISRSPAIGSGKAGWAACPLQLIPHFDFSKGHRWR